MFSAKSCNVKYKQSTAGAFIENFLGYKINSVRNPKIKYARLLSPLGKIKRCERLADLEFSLHLYSRILQLIADYAVYYSIRDICVVRDFYILLPFHVIPVLRHHYRCGTFTFGYTVNRCELIYDTYTLWTWICYITFVIAHSFLASFSRTVVLKIKYPLENFNKILVKNVLYWI